MTKEQIIEEINRVFADTVYPGDDFIVPEEYANCDDYVGAKALLKGKKWQEVDRKEFSPGHYNRECIHFLSEKGLKYYLPSYLLFLVEGIYEADIVTDMVTRILTFPFVEDITELNATLKQHFQDPKDINMLKQLIKTEDSIQEDVEKFHKLVNGFSKEQSLCILHCLEYLASKFDEFDSEDLRKAIERYWKNFKD